MGRVTGAGVELAVLDEGDGDGLPLLLIHGFPDSSRLWRHVVPQLVAAGHRVVAPDLRGLGESDKPTAVEEYAIGRSVADMVAVLDALRIERAGVVGHDWGAVVAWALTAMVPQRVERLAALSVGHPAGARRRRVEDREKSWYMLLFQFEGIAEELLSRDDWALMREWLRGDGDIDHYVADLARPGALGAALNWYRANSHPSRELGRRRPPVPAVTVPTLAVWSSGDHYLREEPMRESGAHVTAEFRYERIEEASHWIPLDAPDELGRLLVEFFA
jgi:pimeloyl-ACP methyl ester carboxylesterase